MTIAIFTNDNNQMQVLRYCPSVYRNTQFLLEGVWEVWVWFGAWEGVGVECGVYSGEK